MSENTRLFPETSTKLASVQCTPYLLLCLCNRFSFAKTAIFSEYPLHQIQSISIYLIMLIYSILFSFFPQLTCCFSLSISPTLRIVWSDNHALAMKHYKVNIILVKNSFFVYLPNFCPNSRKIKV
jgi:hypothetical protein